MTTHRNFTSTRGYEAECACEARRACVPRAPLRYCCRVDYWLWEKFQSRGLRAASGAVPKRHFEIFKAVVGIIV